MLGCRRDVWTDLQKILRVRRIPELSEREGGEAGPAGWNSGSGEEGSYGEVKRYATRCDHRVPLKGGGNCVIGNLTAESRNITPELRKILKLLGKEYENYYV
ncbi:hypothetical protein DSECCO2_584280 [anaerobic digester metagenome]